MNPSLEVLHCNPVTDRLARISSRREGDDIQFSVKIISTALTEKCEENTSKGTRLGPGGPRTNCGDVGVWTEDGLSSGDKDGGKAEVVEVDRMR